MFGENIQTNQYKKFKIEIKWKKCVGWFMMGFLTDTIEHSIMNWRQCIGENLNRDHSVGIAVEKTKKYFYLYDKYNWYKKLSKYQSKYKFAENDIIILSFDFILYILTIYHNGNKAAKLSIKNYKQIIPAFTLSDIKNEEIEIKYEFC